MKMFLSTLEICMFLLTVLVVGAFSYLYISDDSIYQRIDLGLRVGLVYALTMLALGIIHFATMKLDK